MANKLPMIEKEVLLKYKGKTRADIINGERVSSRRVEEAIIRYNIDHLFVTRRISKYVVPSLYITEEQIAPYYNETIAHAAKALGCEYNKFIKGIKRHNLFHKFKGKNEPSIVSYCPICRKNVVAQKYKMCEPCKGDNSYRECSNNSRKRLLPPPPEIECKVYKPGDKDFIRVASQCTHISEIEFNKPAPFLDRFGR